MEQYKVNKAIETYIAQLKNKYHGYSKCCSKQQWPPIPVKFTKLGYVIHTKPKRNAQQTTDMAKKLALSDKFGLKSYQNSNGYFVTIKEEISEIFLPINDDDGCAQLILIEGAPGIGKTMLMIQIGTLWAKGQILQDKRVVLLLPLRELNVDKITSIEEMFDHVCEGMENAQKCKEYFVNNHGQDLVILIDGLDENLQAMKEETFLYKTLIKNNVFSKACIIITSRPHATIDLQNLVSYRVEIIGFTNERRLLFVQENLKENAKELQEYLEKHHTIDTLCYIPLNMSILLFLFTEKSRLKDKYSLPNTQTELLKQAITMTILHNLEKLKVDGLQEADLQNLPKSYDEIFKYICALAYDALSKNKLIFTKKDIVCPVKGDGKVQMAITNGLGLLQAATFFADASSKIDTLSHFAHLSIQEFLAAWYFTFDYWCLWPLPLGCQCSRSLSQVKVLKNKFWNGDYMSVWSFYIGLTGGEDFALKQFLSGSYCMHCSKGFSVSKYILINKIKVLMLYYFLQEAPDNEIIKLLDVVVTPKRLDINGQTVNIKEAKIDLELLGYILSRPYITDQWDMVILSSCEIDDESFEVLHNILTRNDKSPKIKTLLLCNNKLNSCSDIIANLVCTQKIEFLNLSNNKLNGLNHFQKCAGFLETLKISNNELNDEKALELFEILKYFNKLKILSLNNNNISADQKLIDALGLALCCCNSLEELEIYGNMIEDEALLLFEVIIDIRSSVTNVHYYRLSNKAFVFLRILGYCDQTNYTLELNNFRSKIIESIGLNISYNGLPGDAGCLGQHLHLLVNLKILNITKNNVSDEATRSLTIGMLLTSKLVEFKCEKNLFSENSILIFNMIHMLRTTDNEILKCEPSEVKALLFILDCIDDNADKLQSSDIVSVINHVTELNLSHNKLTDRDCKKVCEMLIWFKQLKILDLTNNDITNEVKESLTKAMLQIRNLNTIELIGNPIIDDEFSMSVLETIKNLREEQIQSIVDNQKNSSHKLSHSVIYIMKCLNELKNPDCFKSFDRIITLDIDSELSYVGSFFEYTKFLPSLKHLRINNVKNITDIGINQLSEYLCQNIALLTLDLSLCTLKKLDLKSTPSNRNHRIPLKVLKLNHSNITSEVLLNLSRNVLMFANLEKLDLGSNFFGDNGISNLHSVLISCKSDQLSLTVTTLILANNQLTLNSAVKIVEIVQKCKVKYLDISDNCLGSIFCQFEKFTITTLEELNVSANNHSKDNVVQFAKNLSYLKSCSSLKKLNLSNNSIDETANREIHYTFMECCHLEEVICDDNAEIEVAFYFVKSLQNSTNKNTLQCPPSKIKAVVHLLRAIQDSEEKLQSSDLVSGMSCVTELNLSHNEPSTLEYKLTSQDFKELCGVLSWFKHLKVLDVRNNDISDEIRESLTKVMLQVSVLNTVELIGNPINDDEFSMSVFHTIKILREEQMQSIVDDKKSSSQLSHSIIYILKCLNELENPDCFKSFDRIITLDIDSKSNYVGKYFEYMKFLPSLQSLKINNVANITDIGIDQLGEYLCQNRTLKMLDLSSCNLKKLDIKSAPSGRIPLKVLKLNDSSITHEVVLNLSHMLIRFANLDELDLGKNHFGDSGIDNLHRALTNYKSEKLGITITTLILTNNQLTQSSAVKIVEIVEKCKVKYLNISNNYLGSIFCHFEEFMIATLEELNISANNHSTYNAARFAENISYLKSCSSLKKLDISDNCIDETATDEIHYSLMKCIHFKEVVWTKNPAENDIKRAFELVQNLQYHPSCVKFIDFKELSKAALTLITDSLETLQVCYVTSFNFSNNDLRIDKSFICFLQNCTEVKFLNLENNNITDEAHKFLATGFLFTSNLKLSNLHLKGNPCMSDLKCTSILEMIETLRSNIREFECAPKKFATFLTILEFVHSVDGKPNNIAKTISLIKTLNISYSDLPNPFNRQVDYASQLQSRDVKSFCNYLSYFKSLESINMNGNNIKEDIKDDLAITVLKNFNIVEVHLKKNPIHKVLQYRRLFETIGKLRRCGNKYSFKDAPEALEALVNILQYVNDFTGHTCDITNNIEHLDINSFHKPRHLKRHIGIEKTDNPTKISAGLIHHLTLFCNLKTLNMCNAYLTPDSLEELSRFLGKNNTLQYLDISSNDIQAEGALIILESLNPNTALKKLNLSNNKITGDKVTGIIGSLPKSIEVDMSGNEPAKVSKKSK